MAKASIPVYDICTIDQRSQKDLLIERFGAYLHKHYHNLHLPHRHSFFHLALFTSGSGTHTIDFEQFKVKPMQLYFMIPGQVHSWHFEKNVDGYIIHFNETLLSSFLHNSRYLEQFHFFDGNAVNSICQVPRDAQAEVLGLFEAMLHEMTMTPPQYLDVIRLKLLQLFITINRSCGTNKSAHVPRQKQTLLRSFQHSIDQHFRTIRLPKEYADLLYVTPNHLNALCQDLVGKTAGELIRDRILLEAKRLLTNANMTVAEIAYDLNFQDNSYFNRFFKKGTGVTPEEFRQTFLHPNY